jgi:hypothetical protein
MRAGNSLFLCVSGQIQAKEIAMPAISEPLTPEQREAGFQVEDDEDFVYLKREGETLATWLATRATAQAVRDEADRILAEGKK